MFDRMNLRVEGMCQLLEVRELTSPKNKDWRGYVAKLGTVGDKFEGQVTAELFRTLQAGELYRIVGRLEDQRGNLRLIIDRAEMMRAPAPASAKVS